MWKDGSQTHTVTVGKGSNMQKKTEDFAGPGVVGNLGTFHCLSNTMKLDYSVGIICIVCNWEVFYFEQCQINSYHDDKRM